MMIGMPMQAPPRVQVAMQVLGMTQPMWQVPGEEWRGPANPHDDLDPLRAAAATVVVRYLRGEIADVPLHDAPEGHGDDDEGRDTAPKTWPVEMP